MDPKERFYRHFEAKATEVHEDIANLGNVAVIGGERQDATDHILGGLSRLTNEVSDASEFAPPRDLMMYNEALKALREQLSLQTSRLSPKNRFTFSPTSKEAFLASMSPARRKNSGSSSKDHSNLPDTPNSSNDDIEPPVAAATEDKHDNLSDLPTFSSKNYNAEMAARADPGIRKPSFSSARDIDIRTHHAMHILLPATAARATTAGHVAELHGCVLDMSVPTTSTNTTGSHSAAAVPHPFASLTVNNLTRSLVIAGHVAGPAHITGVRDSVLVVNARQVRIHECENVRVWLWCASRPIIEGCKGMRFAEIPDVYLTEGQDSAHNQWDQVDDFDWLKAKASPNWSTLTAQDEGWIEPRFWETTVRGGPSLSTDDILRAAGVPT